MALNLQKNEPINLTKANASTGLGEILVNLNWNARQTSTNRGLFSSLFGSGNRDIDLDLGCLYELKNGAKGAVQALGNSFGSLNTAPYVSLDGDDRSGSNAAGENIRINGNKLSEISRILVYTFIYDGVANWKDADATVTIKYPGAEDIRVKMDETNSNNKMCGLVLFTNIDDKTFRVEKLTKFYPGHEQLDRDNYWGLKWTPGRK